MTSLTDIYNTLLTGVQSINSLSQTVGKVFPALGVTSTAAPATPGSITFASSQATGFLLVQTSSGAVVKVPTYSSP